MIWEWINPQPISIGSVLVSSWCWTRCNTEMADVHVGFVSLLFPAVFSLNHNSVLWFLNHSVRTAMKRAAGHWPFSVPFYPAVLLQKVPFPHGIMVLNVEALVSGRKCFRERWPRFPLWFVPFLWASSLVFVLRTWCHSSVASRSSVSSRRSDVSWRPARLKATVFSEKQMTSVYFSHTAYLIMSSIPPSTVYKLHFYPQAQRTNFYL